jgi:hypothetical protein
VTISQSLSATLSLSSSAVRQPVGKKNNHIDMAQIRKPDHHTLCNREKAASAFLFWSVPRQTAPATPIEFFFF